MTRLVRSGDGGWTPLPGLGEYGESLLHRVAELVEPHGAEVYVTLTRVAARPDAPTLLCKTCLGDWRGRWVRVLYVDSVPEGAWSEVVGVLSPLCSGEWTIYA